MVGGGHNLVLSLGLGDGNTRTRRLKLGCPVKDGKINNKKNNTIRYTESCKLTHVITCTCPSLSSKCLREWKNRKRDVTPQNEMSCVFPKFPCVIHAEMHVIWLSETWYATSST